MKSIIIAVALFASLVAVTGTVAAKQPEPTESVCTMVCETTCTKCLGGGDGCTPVCTTVCNCR